MAVVVAIEVARHIVRHGVVMAVSVPAAIGCPVPQRWVVEQVVVHRRTVKDRAAAVEPMTAIENATMAPVTVSVVLSIRR